MAVWSCALKRAGKHQADTKKHKNLGHFYRKISHFYAFFARFLAKNTRFFPIPAQMIDANPRFGLKNPVCCVVKLGNFPLPRHKLPRKKRNIEQRVLFDVSRRGEKLFSFLIIGSGAVITLTEKLLFKLFL